MVPENQDVYQLFVEMLLGTVMENTSLSLKQRICWNSFIDDVIEILIGKRGWCESMSNRRFWDWVIVKCDQLLIKSKILFWIFLV